MKSELIIIQPLPTVGVEVVVEALESVLEILFSLADRGSCNDLRGLGIWFGFIDVDRIDAQRVSFCTA